MGVVVHEQFCCFLAPYDDDGTRVRSALRDRRRFFGQWIMSQIFRIAIAMTTTHMLCRSTLGDRYNATKRHGTKRQSAQQHGTKEALQQLRLRRSADMKTPWKE